MDRFLAEMWSMLSQTRKDINKHILLDLIRFSPGDIPYKDPARDMGLRRATITAIVYDLCQLVVLPGLVPSSKQLPSHPINMLIQRR